MIQARLYWNFPFFTSETLFEFRQNRTNAKSKEPTSNSANTMKNNKSSKLRFKIMLASANSVIIPKNAIGTMQHNAMINNTEW